jgi:hypothetical protein
MQTKISEEILRSKLLMNYNSSKTLDENYSFIIEQVTGYEQYLMDRGGDIEYQKEQERKRQEEIANQYPNYCVRPEFAVSPPKNKLGAEGVEALPEAHCYYMTPAGGVYLHQPNLKIETLQYDLVESLVDTFMKYKYNDEKIIKKGIKTIGGLPASVEKVKETIQEKIEESLLKYVGMICEFTVTDKSGVTSKYTLKWNSSKPSNAPMDAKYIYAYPVGFSNYECPDGNCGDIPESANWANPVEVDNRNEFDKWMDKYGTWVELGANALLILAQFIPGVGQVVGLSRLLLYTEVAVDVGFGVANTIREINREDEVSAGLSAFFALLPIAFLRKGGKTLIGKIFSRGIDLSTYDSIAKKLIEARLGKNATTADLYKFYKTLSPEEKVVWKQFMIHDEATKLGFVRDVAKLLNDPSSANDILKSLDEFWEETTKIWAKYGKKSLESIDYMKRLWVRQMSMVGIGTALEAIGQFVGSLMNTETKKEFEWIGKTIPLSQQEMLFVNFATNPESINQTIESVKNQPGYQDFKNTIDSLNTGSANDKVNINFAEYLNSQVDSISNSTSIPSEKDVKEETLNETELGKIELEGWVWQGDERVSDFIKKSPPEFNNTNYRMINNRFYIKVPLNLIKKEEPKKKEETPKSNILPTIK